ncbi:MAG: tRNA guanosine(34) transglycosylase Tgt [Spirochaetaceae bacterium]
MFTTTALDSSCEARLGRLELGHGSVDTPVFMPVGTQGTVKALSQEDLEAMGFGLILGNTYHLSLRPGIETIDALGGLHRFISWDGNILTDSGGFQIFSLETLRTLDEGGVSFRSHLDGSPHRFTPERVVDLQQRFGSDIMMPLDVCAAHGAGRAEAQEALRLTTDWARRSKRAWDTEGAGRLFGIVQGNFYQDLRRQSAAELRELDFPGYAVGGLSVGEGRTEFNDTLGWAVEGLPKEKPRYVMGIGTPDLIFDAVEQGVDMFDCVFPTRAGRNATALTAGGRIALRNAEYARDSRPIEEACPCPVCRRYSRAYIRHLFKGREILAAMLTTRHNLWYMRRLMEGIHEAIRGNDLPGHKRRVLEALEQDREASSVD